MKQEIDTEKALNGTPRPHYLRGSATYEQRDQQYSLLATVFFSSDAPSVGDRSKNYLANPHVNSGDVCFAVWNAAHIIGDLQGYSTRTLVDKIEVTPHAPVPPDKTLSLEICIEEIAHKTDRHEKHYSLGKITGKIYDGETLLTEVSAIAFVRK